MVKLFMKRAFGDRLKEARKECGLTQEEIAGLLGIKQQRYQPWEGGKAGKQIEPPHDMLQQLSEILNKSVSWLLTGKEPQRLVDRIMESPSRYSDVAEKIMLLVRDMDTPT